MAKRVRRVKKKSRQRKPKNKAVVQETADPNAVVPEKASSKGKSSGEGFKQEYAYVVKDLRRVLILAAVLFMLLIAINLILQ